MLVKIVTAELLSHLDKMLENLKPYLIRALQDTVCKGDVKAFTKFFGEDLEKLKKVAAGGDISAILAEYNRILERWKKALNKDALKEMQRWLDEFVNAVSSVVSNTKVYSQSAPPGWVGGGSIHIPAPTGGSTISGLGTVFDPQSKKDWATGQQTTINVTVQGSVTTEKELASSISSIYIIKNHAEF